MSEFHSKRETGLRPDLCVDDHPAYLVGGKGNVRVSPYEGGSVDRELELVQRLIVSLTEEESG